eukprot:856055-Heterocapsa_arctica.AAC.1
MFGNGFAVAFSCHVFALSHVTVRTNCQDIVGHSSLKVMMAGMHPNEFACARKVYENNKIGAHGRDADL